MSDPTPRRPADLDLIAAIQRGARADSPSVDAMGQPLPVPIEGVTLARVRPHEDARGGLVPFLDVRQPFWGEPVVYGYWITVRPGRIKGWGMHRVQADRYFVARGSVRVVLFDGRESSSTSGQLAELYFTDATPGLLRIPPGVWHADQNWGETDAFIVNLPTHPYDPASPDKYRIDPHSGIIPFDWRLRDG